MYPLENARLTAILIALSYRNMSRVSEDEFMETDREIFESWVDYID